MSRAPMPTGNSIENNIIGLTAAGTAVLGNVGPAWPITHPAR